MREYLWRIAIGNVIQEFESDTPAHDVWQFLQEHLEHRDDEIAVVFQDDGGFEHGKILNAAAFYTLFETPEDVERYIRQHAIQYE